MVRSLNVSVAAALLLYEAQRQRTVRGLYAGDPPRIPEPRFTELLFEWAYPRLATRFRELDLPYPALGPDGEIVGDLSALAPDPSPRAIP
jgi:tRNA (guanosine-2'-O-)-methyltransferase